MLFSSSWSISPSAHAAAIMTFAIAVMTVVSGMVSSKMNVQNPIITGFARLHIAS